MGKKISMDDAIERLQAKGWKTSVDSRYLTASSSDGGAYQFVPTSDNRIELKEVRAVPEYRPSTSR